MAVPRVEWQCPGCQRKFAIPSQQPRPKLCPDCQRNAAATPERNQPATFPPAISGEPELELSDAPSEPVPVLSGPQAQPARPVKRRKYEVLRTISMWFKVLAGLIGFVFLMALAGMAKFILDNPDFPNRMELVFSWFATVVTGVTVVLLVYSFAVLLLVAMDIESNTREE